MTARLRMRPIGRDVLDDLVASGDLDQAIADQMPTFDVGGRIEWTKQSESMKPIAAQVTSDCITYRCQINDGSAECH